MRLRVASVSYKRFSAIFPTRLFTLDVKCGKPSFINIWKPRQPKTLKKSKINDGWLKITQNLLVSLHRYAYYN